MSAAVLLIGLVGLAGVFWQWRVAAVASAEIARARENEAIAARNEVSRVNVGLQAARDDAERQRNEVSKANLGLKEALRQSRQNDAEGRYLREPADEITPEAQFVHRWAIALLEGVLEDLRGEYTRTGKSDLFAALKPTLTGDPRAARHAEIAARLGMTEGAVQVAVHRLRTHYRAALRARIAATVAEPADIEAEIRDLFAALAS